MLIKKAREFDRFIGGKATCPYCTLHIAGPPALLIDKNQAAYHIDCAMQLIYGVLTDLSGSAPALHTIEPSELSGMAQAFRAAKEGRDPSLD